MNQPKERWAVSLAGLALVISVLCFGYLTQVPQKMNRSALSLETNDYRSTFINKNTGATPTFWVAPEPMSRGTDWVYDVFTPPEVYYDAQSGQFRLTPPSREVAISPNVISRTEVRPGLTLHAVEREQFPLQLIGFVGEMGNYLGTFENKVTHETLLLREGAVVDALQMAVREFRVEQVAREIPDSMTVKERQAVAVIYDERTGEQTLLRQGEKALTSGRLASVSLDMNGEVVIVVEGELIDAGEEQYRIEKIRLAPPEVDVSKERRSDGASESYTLRPMAPKPPDDKK